MRGARIDAQHARARSARRVREERPRTNAGVARDGDTLSLRCSASKKARAEEGKRALHSRL
jgi:hypothetical protein